MKMSRSMLVAMAVGSLGFALHAERVNSILAVVHDSVVTLQEVESSTLDVARELRRPHQNQRDVYQRRLAEARSESLERLLERQLILHEFATAGYILPESVIDELVEERLQSVPGGNRVTLTKTLQAQGLTYEKWRQRLRDDFVVS